MEAILWIAAAFFIYYLMKRKGGSEGTPSGHRPLKIYSFISMLAALLCACIIRFVCHIHYLSIWLVLTYTLIACQCSYMLWCFLFAPLKSAPRQLLSMILKLGVVMGFLGLYYLNLAHDVIGFTRIADDLLPPVSTGMADAVLLFSAAIWLYGGAFLKKHPEGAKGLRWCLLAISPLLIFLMVEINWNSSVAALRLSGSVLNILIYLLIEIVFVQLFRKNLRGLQLFYIVAWLVGALNGCLMRFRGQPLLPTDLSAWRTASSVASQYNFVFTEEMAFTLLALFFLFTCMQAIGQADVCAETAAAQESNASDAKKRPTAQSVKTRETVLRTPEKSMCKSAVRRPGRPMLRRLAGAAAALSALCLWIGRTSFTELYHIDLDFWNQAIVYQTNGFAAGFVSFLQKMKVEKPAGYTETAVEQLLDSYIDEEGTSSTADASQKKPTIIAIMNESFSDLSALGPLSCTEEHLAFLHSLKDDPRTIEYGWNYVSTRGGGTSTTEFEYLTGNSMAFTNGINPYSGFDFTDVPSMVSNLKSQGYHTIAMHPEYAENWRRNLVYPKLGFDEFMFIDSFAESDRTIWDRVSDLGDYQKLIEVYEAQTGPSFIFNVTMQNHGGYEFLSELPSEEIVDIDEAYRGYTDVQMYESLIAKADKSLAYLMHYFEKVDEPVILCFFGDHQPSLNSEFENALQEAGRTAEDTDLSITETCYAVPYFIWSNYDIQENYAKKNAKGENVISTNYLGALTTKYAGLRLTAYDAYLLDQREQLPAFNFIAYMTESGDWYEINADTALSTWKDQYQQLQYYALFDKNRKGVYF